MHSLDTTQLVALAAALGWASGIRLYAVLFITGAVGYLGWFDLPEHLRILEHPLVLGASLFMFVAEFFADKIPYLDTAWDAVHTFIRPVGAAVLAAAALGDMDPALRTCMAILAGGVALTSHSGKAATRALANHSPEPFSNVALSFMEDAIIPVGVWLATAHPLVTLTVVIILVVLTALFIRVAYRALRSTFRAIRRPA